MRCTLPHGFTLIELMLALAVLSVLAVTAAPRCSTCSAASACAGPRKTSAATCCSRAPRRCG
ncbi:MAG: type II secretion system protein [Gammaproteobacteria bacterium]|nr:type II secretion system protein [Gammaproteobacteria bacterium]